MILAALVKRDHVAAQTGLVERFLFDLRHHGAAGEERLLNGHLRFHGGVHARRDILDAHEDIQFEIETAFFFRLRPGVKAVAQVIFVFVTELLQGVGADVMIRYHQAVLGDKGTGAAAVETHGRFLDVVEPRFGHVEAVFFLELFARRVVEQPHAFVRLE